MSDVLDYVRSKEPAFKQVDDDTLTEYIADRQPEFLNRSKSFSLDYQKIISTKPGGSLAGAESGVTLPSPKPAPDQAPAIPKGTFPVSPFEGLTQEQSKSATEPTVPDWAKDPRYVRNPIKAETPSVTDRDQDKPLLNLGDYLIKPPSEAKGPIEAGINEALRPAINSLTTPRNLVYMAASMGLASTGTVGKALVSALWTGLMGKNAVEEAPKIAAELGQEMALPEDKRDKQKIAKLLTQAGIDTAMAVAPALHTGEMARAGLESEALQSVPGLPFDVSKPTRIGFEAAKVAAAGAPATAQALAEVGQTVQAKAEPVKAPEPAPVPVPAPAPTPPPSGLIPATEAASEAVAESKQAMQMKEAEAEKPAPAPVEEAKPEPETKPKPKEENAVQPIPEKPVSDVSAQPRQGPEQVPVQSPIPENVERGGQAPEAGKKEDVRVFYDDAVKAYTATAHDPKFGNMHGTGETEEAAVSDLNKHLEAARQHGTWRSVEHPSEDQLSGKTGELKLPPAPEPKPSTEQDVKPEPSKSDHHVAVYGGKEVPIDYVKDPKREFKVAAQRVHDNLEAGRKGYVKTPDGKIFEISRDSKRAKPVSEIPQPTPLAPAPKPAEGATGEVKKAPKTDTGQEKPYDTVSEAKEILGKGKISLSKARKLIENFKPIGAARELFGKEGVGPDEVHRDMTKQFPDDVAFLESLNESAQARKGERSGAASEKKQINTQADKQTQFDNATKEGPGKEPVDLTQYYPGAEFTVDGQKVKLDNFAFDDNEEITGTRLNGGNKFGDVQVLAGTKIHIDKGSLKEKGGEPEFVPEPKTEPPKLRPGEKSGEMFQGEDQPFNLAGEKGTDAERIAAEKAKAEKDKSEAKAIADKQQQGLFEKPALKEGDKVWVGQAPMHREGTISASGPRGGWFVKTNLGEVFYEAKDVRPFDQGPPTIGVGGAIPPEFNEPGTVVSNMFSAIDRDRVAMGKPPMPDTERRTWDQDNAKALAQMNRDPNWVPNLIAEVLKKPRPLLSWENAGLVWHRQKITAELNNALSRIAQAFDDNRTQDLAEAKVSAAVFEDQLEELDRAVGRNGTGSEAGRTLQAQKMGAGDDFSLIEMRLRKRAAVGGRPLTDAESSQIAKLHEQIAEAEKAHKEEVLNRDQRIAELEVKAALDKVALEAKREPTVEPHVRIIADKIKGYFDNRADAALKRLSGKLFTLSPQVLADLTDLGVSKILSGAIEFGEWGVKMAEALGDRIKPHLQTVWDSSQKALNDHVQKVAGGQAPKVQRAVRGIDLNQQKDIAKTNIKNKVDAGKRNEVTNMVRKLARIFVEQGVKQRDQLIDAVHGVLQEVDPTFTRRETMDAISGYGDFKQLSKDQISVELRDLKRQMQEVAKLEDMEAGQPPLKTGIERAEVTREQSRLIKLVNEAKRKFQVPISDPGTQLKSSLDTLKTRMSNRIEELNQKMADKDFTTKPKREIQLDTTATRLKANYERVKRKYQEMLIADRLKNRTRWEKALDWTTKFRRFSALSSPMVIPKLFGAAGWRAVFTLAEDVAGEALSVIPGIRGISQRAPTEGAGRQLKATMRGYGGAFTKGMTDAVAVAKTGRSDLDVLYGKQGESYTGENELASLLLNIPGRSHGVIKAPVKRGGFEKAKSRLEYWHENTTQKLGEWYAKQGFPVDSEFLKYRIAMDAYKYGNQQIFLQDSRIASAFNAALAALERKGESGHPNPGGKVLATAARFMFPVTKVPTNIAGETLKYAAGSVTGSVRAINAIRKGLDTLTPNQADLIMQELKKGSIGFAALALGYIGYEQIGGLYEQGKKRKPGELKPGDIEMFGERIPANILHHPALNTIQLGAAIHQTADEKLRKKDEDAQGIPAGILAAAWGIADEVPFVQGPHRLFGGLANRYTRQQTIGNEARSIAVPQIMAWTAQVLDERRETEPSNLYERITGPPAKLDPKTIWESIETGIPGLRQQIPEKR